MNLTRFILSQPDTRPATGVFKRLLNDCTWRWNHYDVNASQQLSWQVHIGNTSSSWRFVFSISLIKFQSLTLIYRTKIGLATCIRYFKAKPHSSWDKSTARWRWIPHTINYPRYIFVSTHFFVTFWNLLTGGHQKKFCFRDRAVWMDHKTLQRK